MFYTNNIIRFEQRIQDNVRVAQPKLYINATSSEGLPTSFKVKVLSQNLKQEDSKECVMEVVSSYINMDKMSTEIIPTGQSKNQTHTVSDGAYLEWEFDTIFYGPFLEYSVKKVIHKSYLDAKNQRDLLLAQVLEGDSPSA